MPSFLCLGLRLDHCQPLFITHPCSVNLDDMTLAVFFGDIVAEVDVENLFMVSKLLLQYTVDVVFLLLVATLVLMVPHLPLRPLNEESLMHPLYTITFDKRTTKTPNHHGNQQQTKSHYNLYPRLDICCAKSKCLMFCSFVKIN